MTGRNLNKVAALALTAAAYESAGPVINKLKTLVEDTVQGALTAGILAE